MTHQTKMILPVRMETSVCYCGPTNDHPMWSGAAYILGNEVAVVYEQDGCHTEGAVVRALTERVRSYSRETR